VSWEIKTKKIYKIYGCCFVMKKDYASFVLVVLVGLVMALTVLGKLFFGFDVDSDWFWFLAGVGLAVEGVISFRARKRFDQKYKILKR